jgi:hypothetical protein
LSVARSSSHATGHSSHATAKRSTEWILHSTSSEGTSWSATTHIDADSSRPSHSSHSTKRTKGVRSTKELAEQKFSLFWTHAVMTTAAAAATRSETKTGHATSTSETSWESSSHGSTVRHLVGLIGRIFPIGVINFSFLFVGQSRKGFTDLLKVFCRLFISRVLIGMPLCPIYIKIIHKTKDNMVCEFIYCLVKN